MSHDPSIGRTPRSPESRGGAPESRGGAPRQVVRSAEQVELELPIAGPASRMLAYAIDFLALVVIQVALLALLLLVGVASEGFQRVVDEAGERAGDLVSGDPAQVSGAMIVFITFFVLFQLVAEWGYFIVSEMATGGRSLGKAAVGLRVVRDGGGALTLRASLARNLLRLADVLPSSYLVGLIAMVASREGKRLGDLVAGTVVLRLDDAPLAAPIVTPEDLDPAEFRLDRSQLEALRPIDQTLIRQTLRRVDELGPERGAEALDRACAALCTRLGREPVPAARQRAFLASLYAQTQPR